MKTCLLLLVVALCVHSFCPAIQQTLSAPAPTTQPAVDEVEDSDVFFQRATNPQMCGRISRARYQRSWQLTPEERWADDPTRNWNDHQGDGDNIQIDPEKLDKAVVKYGAGSILNVKDQALTIDKWHEIIGAIQTASQRTRLKIPVIYGIDSIHGANYIQGSTLFPQEIGMAATWNPVLMQRGAEVSTAETRVARIPWTFSPVLDLGRQPRWPRFWETFGEDPYLAKVMGRLSCAASRAMMFRLRKM